MRALAHQVDTESSRLWLHRGAPLAMTRAHRHDDVEFNLVLSGSLTYTFWGEPLSVEGGELAVFWGRLRTSCIPMRRRAQPKASGSTSPLPPCWGGAFLPISSPGCCNRPP